MPEQDSGYVSKQQCEQLYFVAYLTDSNDKYRDNERFHGLAP
jgi:hypothetical protein